MTCRTRCHASVNPMHLIASLETRHLTTSKHLANIWLGSKLVVRSDVSFKGANKIKLKDRSLPQCKNPIRTWDDGVILQTGQ